MKSKIAAIVLALVASLGMVVPVAASGHVSPPHCRDGRLNCL